MAINNLEMLGHINAATMGSAQDPMFISETVSDGIFVKSRHRFTLFHESKHALEGRYADGTIFSYENTIRDVRK